MKLLCSSVDKWYKKYVDGSFYLSQHLIIF